MQKNFFLFLSWETRNCYSITLQIESNRSVHWIFVSNSKYRFSLIEGHLKSLCGGHIKTTFLPSGHFWFTFATRRNRQIVFTLKSKEKFYQGLTTTGFISHYISPGHVLQHISSRRQPPCIHFLTVFVVVPQVETNKLLQRLLWLRFQAQYLEKRSARSEINEAVLFFNWLCSRWRSWCLSAN